MSNYSFVGLILRTKKFKKACCRKHGGSPEWMCITDMSMALPRSTTSQIHGNWQSLPLVYVQIFRVYAKLATTASSSLLLPKELLQPEATPYRDLLKLTHLTSSAGHTPVLKLWVLGLLCSRRHYSIRKHPIPASLTCVCLIFSTCPFFIPCHPSQVSRTNLCWMLCAFRNTHTHTRACTHTNIYAFINMYVCECISVYICEWHTCNT